MIALPMQKASTMHTITSSRSPYGSCSFKCIPAGHSAILRQSKRSIGHRGKSFLDVISPRLAARFIVPFKEPGPSAVVVVRSH
jgi:hypothetical protein